MMKFWQKDIENIKVKSDITQQRQIIVLKYDKIIACIPNNKCVKNIVS